MSVLKHVPAGADPIEALMRSAEANDSAKPLRRLVVANDIWSAIEDQARRPLALKETKIGAGTFATATLATPVGTVDVVRDGYLAAGTYFEDRGQFDPPKFTAFRWCDEYLDAALTPLPFYQFAPLKLDTRETLLAALMYEPPRPQPILCSAWEFDFMTALAAGKTPYLAGLRADLNARRRREALPPIDPGAFAGLFLGIEPPHSLDEADRP